MIVNMRSQERRARRIEADRADSIAAAERVFARVGYAAASVRDIAREGNFSVGGVDKVVDSKDDLYVAVIARVWAEYQAALAPALAAGSFEDRLRAVTRTWLAFFAARRAFMSVLMSEKANWPPAFHERVDRLVQNTAGSAAPDCGADDAGAHRAADSICRCRDARLGVPRSGEPVQPRCPVEHAASTTES